MSYSDRHLGLFADACSKTGRIEEGLATLSEAFAFVEQTGERLYEAKLYRLKGELVLQSKTSLGQVSGKSKTSQNKSAVTKPRSPAPDPQGEAEACFLKALAIAQQQQAKSLELRAASSLARLWQRQGKIAEAWALLSKVYNWFTEGFDTADLQEAKALLDLLS